MLKKPKGLHGEGSALENEKWGFIAKLMEIGTCDVRRATPSYIHTKLHVTWCAKLHVTWCAL